ncbi:uncharacterized protein LOC126819425 [Patella vulgata]|uniref:uncharacterized protein LOC126819425 n=1 Tax=Patella vulgata TaxID=6465 RepID=UPI0021803703|nr:uncharacterized protein LOC126819425 [Patella vulgata]
MMNWTSLASTVPAVTSKTLGTIIDPIPNLTLNTNNSVNVNRSLLHDTQINVEKRLIEVLKGHNLTAFQYFSKLAGIPTYLPPTTTSQRVPFTSGVVSWAFIAPITIIGLFLFAVAACLLFHNWRDKRRLQRYSPSRQNPEFNRQGAENNSKRDRGSARSTTSARSTGASTFGKGQIVPLGRKASLRLTPDEDGWKIANQPQILSPIDELDSSNSKTAVTEIKPKFFSSHERFAPYHLTWIAQSSKDTEMQHVNEKQPIHVIENPITNQIGNDQYYEESKVVREMEKTSPFYPHHTTPTTEYDRESEFSGNLQGGDSAVSTHIHDNVSLPSTIYPVIGRAPPSLTDGADLSSIHTLPENRSQYNIHSNPLSATTSFTDSASGSLSLPSSISRFHASRLNNTPNYAYPLASTCYNGSHAKLNFTATSSIDISENNSHYSDNTSMFPNVGSSITSFNPSVPRSNPTSSCASDIFSPDRPYSNVGGRQYASHPGTGTNTRQNSFSTNSADGHVPPTAENSRVSPAREAEMFRSWSLGADVNSGSLGNLPAIAPASLPSGEPYPVFHNKDDSNQSKSDGHITTTSYDFNHNQSPDNRKVKFSVPVLNKKQYWV